MKGLSIVTRNMSSTVYTIICIFCMCLQESSGADPIDNSDLAEFIPTIFKIPDTPKINLDPIDESSEESDTGGKINLDPNFAIENDTSECKDKCVWHYQCNNGSIETNGVGLIKPREKNIPCGDIFHVCCKLEDISTSSRAPQSPPVAPSEGCGYRGSTGFMNRITAEAGGESKFAEFPWMAAIFGGDAGPFPKCGGALVHPQAVITAAHCIESDDNRGKFTVRVGEWDLNKTSEPFLHQEVPVRSVKIHEEFDAAPLFNDIAFLYLERPVELAPNVEVICLPPQNHLHSNGKCFSTGWGKNKDELEGEYQSVLKKIDLPFVPRDTCLTQLRKTRLGRFFNLHRSFMCAGGEKGKDACTGDGGSPLVCPMQGFVGRYYQAGIVAWGVGCGDADVPGVYVDVAQFRDWIDEQMRSNKLDAERYNVPSGGL